MWDGCSSVTGVESDVETVFVDEGLASEGIVEVKGIEDEDELADVWTLSDPWGWLSLSLSMGAVKGMVMDRELFVS